MLVLTPWITDEMKTSALPDKRLNERLRQVLSQLAARPTASIPAACGGRAEMVAAYRFFENENTNFDSVLQPHRDATRNAWPHNRPSCLCRTQRKST